MNSVANKVAIVTGASRGIGAAIAKALGAAGAAVVVNYSTSKDAADRVVAEIVTKGGKAIAVQADVRKGPDVKRLFETTAKQLGKLDILINNAVIYKFAPFESVTEEDFHQHIGCSS